MAEIPRSSSGNEPESPLELIVVPRGTALFSVLPPVSASVCAASVATR